jgi:zinc protease
LDAHRAALARDRVHVSAVGDITAEELGALLDRLLGDLPETGAALPEVADVALPGGTKVEPFETPQSVALFAQHGPDRHDPDFLPAYVLNHILGGGGFESRLMSELREKRGLTYGVYSYLADKDAADLWMGSVSSDNARVGEAIALVRDEWARLREEGVSAEELADAKTYLTGAYPLRFEGNAQIASIAVGMQMDGLDPEYIARRNAMVEAITLDDINRPEMDGRTDVRRRA